jgi:hypothetical protein
VVHSEETSEIVGVGGEDMVDQNVLGV